LADNRIGTVTNGDELRNVYEEIEIRDPTEEDFEAVVL